MKKLIFIFTVFLAFKANAQTFINKEPNGKINITDLNGISVPSGTITYSTELQKRSGNISFYKLKSICIDCASKDSTSSSLNGKNGDEFLEKMRKQGVIDTSFKVQHFMNRIFLTEEQIELSEVSFENYYCVRINSSNKTIEVIQPVYVLQKDHLDLLLNLEKLEEGLFTLQTHF